MVERGIENQFEWFGGRSNTHAHIANQTINDIAKKKKMHVLPINFIGFTHFTKFFILEFIRLIPLATLYAPFHILIFYFCAHNVSILLLFTCKNACFFPAVVYCFRLNVWPKFFIVSKSELFIISSVGQFRYDLHPVVNVRSNRKKKIRFFPFLVHLNVIQLIKLLTKRVVILTGNTVYKHDLHHDSYPPAPHHHAT